MLKKITLRENKDAILSAIKKNGKAQTCWYLLEISEETWQNMMFLWWNFQLKTGKRRGELAGPQW